MYMYVYMHLALCATRSVAKQMGQPVPKVPIIFMKPTSSYATQGQTIQVLHQLGQECGHHVKSSLMVNASAACANLSMVQSTMHKFNS